MRREIVSVFSALRNKSRLLRDPKFLALRAGNSSVGHSLLLPDCGLLRSSAPLAYYGLYGLSRLLSLPPRFGGILTTRRIAHSN